MKFSLILIFHVVLSIQLVCYAQIDSAPDRAEDGSNPSHRTQNFDACEKELSENGCNQLFDADPSLKAYKRNCSDPKDSANQFSRQRLWDCMDQIKKVSHQTVIQPFKSASDAGAALGRSISSWLKNPKNSNPQTVPKSNPATQSCDENLDCLKRLAMKSGFGIRQVDNSCKLPKDFDPAFWTEADYRRRRFALQEQYKRTQTIAEKRRLEDTCFDFSFMDEDPLKMLISPLEDYFKKQRLKYLCYNVKGYTELACYSLTYAATTAVLATATSPIGKSLAEFSLSKSVRPPEPQAPNDRLKQRLAKITSPPEPPIVPPPRKSKIIPAPSVVPPTSLRKLQDIPEGGTPTDLQLSYSSRAKTAKTGHGYIDGEKVFVKVFEPGTREFVRNNEILRVDQMDRLGIGPKLLHRTKVNGKEAIVIQYIGDIDDKLLTLDRMDDFVQKNSGWAASASTVERLKEIKTKLGSADVEAIDLQLMVSSKGQIYVIDPALFVPGNGQSSPLTLIEKLLEAGKASKK